VAVENLKPTLFNAILALETDEECSKFFDDLLTPQELTTLVKRWQAFLLLKDGTAQRNVAEILQISVATVSRVNRALRFGKGGYKLVLGKIRRDEANLR